VSSRAIETAAVVLVALICAIAPFPPERIEAWYSSDWYLRLQGVVTTASNTIPIAWLDIGVACLLVAAIELVISRTRLLGAKRALTRNLMTAAGAAAWLYLLFLALWGFNYRRVPLEQKLDYEQSRLTREAALAFTDSAAVQVNAGYAAAHANPFTMDALAASFAETQIALGATRLAVPGVPKRSLLNYYFRRAAIDGMTDPYFLEIIVNPDVLDFERPFVIAHEWAHLAGYANEAEANFLAWLTCVRGKGPQQYSGWLAAYQRGMAAVPRADRGTLKPLEEGPRKDLEAMAARYAMSSALVRRTAQGVYDEYLKANRIREGIASYDAVVRLMIGVRYDDGWKPRAR
jgi:uncharacterized protein DUF3810